MNFTDRHLVIRCEGKFYNKFLKQFVPQITASCLFYNEDEMLKASDSLDFVHEVLVVECEYFKGMACRILEGSTLDEFYKLE